MPNTSETKNRVVQSQGNNERCTRPCGDIESLCRTRENHERKQKVIKMGNHIKVVG
jgi:hypothetical protein